MRATPKRGEKPVVQWVKTRSDGRLITLSLSNEGRLSEWTPPFVGDSLEARMSGISRRIPTPRHTTWKVSTAGEWALRNGYSEPPSEVGPVPSWLR